MSEVRARNRAAGFLFFSAGAMETFQSRVETDVAYCDGSGQSFFVTSEAMREDGPRMYKVRRQDASTGRIWTDGEPYGNRDDAVDAAKALATQAK
jgi:hypothetical protein